MILTELLGSHLLSSIIAVVATVVLFQFITMLQRKFNVIWLQPMLLSILVIIEQWKSILLILSIGALIAIISSFIITMLIIGDYTIAVALSLKSITTPIAIAIAGQLDGNTAITAFAVMLAGIFGALIGPRWLTYIKVRSPKAQGLAIGAASHAIGTATVSNISYEHAAFGSLALIVSAVITALTSPFIISFLAALL